MAFNKTWDEDEPTDSTLGKDIDNVTRALKEALRERLQQEHAFYEDESTHDDVGEHKKGSARIDFGLQADRPSVNPDNPGSVYVETDTLSVFYDNGSNWINLMQVNFEAIDDHASLTQNIHGVGSSDVESVSGAQSKVDTHEGKGNPHSDSASNPHDNAQHSTNYTTLTEVNNNADVPDADYADNAGDADKLDGKHDGEVDANTFKGNDIDSDGDGKVNNADSANLIKDEIDISVDKRGSVHLASDDDTVTIDLGNITETYLVAYAVYADSSNELTVGCEMSDLYNPDGFYNHYAKVTFYRKGSNAYEGDIKYKILKVSTV